MKVCQSNSEYPKEIFIRFWISAAGGPGVTRLLTDPESEAPNVHLNRSVFPSSEFLKAVTLQFHGEKPRIWTLLFKISF